MEGYDIVKRTMDEAAALAQSGSYPEALEKYLWCFDHALEHRPGYHGVRLSFLLHYIADLGEKYPPAIEALEQRRDAAEVRLRTGEGNTLTAADFSALNDILGSADRTLSLYTEFKRVDPPQRGVLELFRHDHRLTEMLLEHKRYGDFLEDIGDVSEAVDRSIEMLEYAIEHFCEDNGRYYEALLGVGQDGEAEDLAQTLLQSYPWPETYRALIKGAIYAGKIEVAKAWMEQGRDSLTEDDMEEFGSLLQPDE